MNGGRHLDHDWFPWPLPVNVEFGERSWCYSAFAFLHCRSRRPCGVRVGHDTGIYHGTFFELGPEGEVQIGNYCTLVGTIIATNGRVSIGDYCFLAHEVVLADAAVAGPWEAGAGAAAAGPATALNLAGPPPGIETGSASGPRPHGEFARVAGVISGAGSSRPPDFVLGDTSWIGARAILLPGARVGRGAIVGAGAVVDFEVPPYAVVAGNPARVVGWTSA